MSVDVRTPGEAPASSSHAAAQPPPRQNKFKLHTEAPSSLIAQRPRPSIVSTLSKCRKWVARPPQNVPEV